MTRPRVWNLKQWVEATEDQVTSYKEELYKTSTAAKCNRLLWEIKYVSSASVQIYAIIYRKDLRMAQMAVPGDLKSQTAMTSRLGMTVGWYFEKHFLRA